MISLYWGWRTVSICLESIWSLLTVCIIDLNPCMALKCIYSRHSLVDFMLFLTSQIPPFLHISSSLSIARYQHLLLCHDMPCRYFEKQIDMTCPFVLWVPPCSQLQQMTFSKRILAHEQLLHCPSNYYRCYIFPYFFLPIWSLGSCPCTFLRNDCQSRGLLPSII